MSETKSPTLATKEEIENPDSERLRNFIHNTIVEVKAVGMISAATSLEMIEYIRELESREAEKGKRIEELEGLARRVGELTGCVAMATGRTWGEGGEGKHWARRFEQLNDAISELRSALPLPPSEKES